MGNPAEPIIVEQNIQRATNEVWDAITQVVQMRDWFFDNIPAFEPVAGFETRFMVKTPERNFLHQWKITEAVPGRKLTYHWTYSAYPGEGYVTFELFGNNYQTTLRLTTLGMESFPQDIPEFTRKSCLGGWNYFIKERLKNYLEAAEK